MITKDQFISWKRSEAGRAFEEEINKAAEVFSEMAGWVPELAPQVEMPDE